MAFQNGPLGLRGRIGGLVFRRDGVVSQAPPSNRDQFLNAPSYARVRENATEFAAAAQAGKLLRTALRTVLQSADRYMIARLNATLLRALRLDTENPRGLRVLKRANLGGLLGFEFNNRAPLATVLQAAVQGSFVETPYSVVGDSWLGLVFRLHIPALRPLVDLAVPVGATHYQIVAVPLALDYEQGDVHVLPYAEDRELPEISPLAGSAVEIDVRTADVVSHSTDTTAYAWCLGVRWYQLVNGRHYEVAQAQAALSLVWLTLGNEFLYLGGGDPEVPPPG